MTSLRPATDTDVDAITRTYAAYDERELGEADIDASDVRAMLTSERSESVVLEDASRVVGFADLSESGEAETVVDPDHPRATELQRELLTWVETRARERGVARLEHWAGTDPDGATRLLVAAGYEHARTIWKMHRELAGVLPEPVWPPTCQVTAFDQARDGRSVWELVQRGFAGTFGSHQRPFDEWALFALGEDKDAVCVVEHGRLIAVATTGPRGGDGHVAQLTVEPEHRGRGLALSLLHEAFRRDAAAGRTATTLTVDGENDSARRLYEKAGMRVVGEYRRWERDV